MDAVTQSQEKAVANPMLESMLGQLKSVVEPALQRFNAPEKVMTTWAEFVNAVREWLGGV